MMVCLSSLMLVFLNKIFPDWLEGVVQELGQHAHQICPHCTFSCRDMLKL